MKSIKDTKLYLFDLDGTIYHDGVLIDGVKDTLIKLRERGAKIVYLTNNSSAPKDGYEEKLKKIGIFEPNDMVYSSLDCAIDFLSAKRTGKKIYALATEKVREYLKAQGLNIVEEKYAHTADIALMAFDKELNYQKMVTFNELLVMGKEYISTHPDKVCPTRGISIPDAGSFIEMFKSSSGREPDIILGKPYTYIAEFLLEKLGVKKEQTTMVGDRLSTDIKFGLNISGNAVLVLTGEATLSDHEKCADKADFVLDSVNNLLDFYK